jgi:hypothetical protein
VQRFLERDHDVRFDIAAALHPARCPKPAPRPPNAD